MRRARHAIAAREDDHRLDRWHLTCTACEWKATVDSWPHVEDASHVHVRVERARELLGGGR